MIGFHRPIAKQVHAAHFDAFRQVFEPETSGLTARASGGDFAFLHQ